MARSEIMEVRWIWGRNSVRPGTFEGATSDLDRRRQLVNIELDAIPSFTTGDELDHVIGG